MKNEEKTGAKIIPKLMNVKYYTLLLFVFQFLALSQSNAQIPLDLKKALTYTLEHHTAIQQAQIDIEIGKETLRESVSSGLPQLNANATILNNLSLRTSLIPAEFLGGPPGEFAQLKFGTNWNANAGIQLNQMVFNKQWLLAIEASKRLTDFYDVGLLQSKEEVIYETAKLYYQVQLTATHKGILAANLERVSGLLTVTQKQWKNGIAKKIDVDRILIQQSNLLTQISNLDLQIKQLQQALKFAMQMPLETEIVLTDSLVQNTDAKNKKLLGSNGYSNRPALGILNIQQDLYDLDFRRWKAGFFPTVNLFASYSYEWQANNISDFTEGMRWTDFSQVGLRFNIPIFDGFFKDSQIEKAKLNKMRTAKQYEAILLAYQLQHESALTTFHVNQNNLEDVMNTRTIAEEVYQITLKRYKEGIAPITELLEAESAMSTAQSNYITTLAQIKLAEVDILHANGKLIQLVEE